MKRESGPAGAAAAAKPAAKSVIVAGSGTIANATVPSMAAAQFPAPWLTLP